jgi:hypothetical protein
MLSKLNKYGFHIVAITIILGLIVAMGLLSYNNNVYKYNNTYLNQSIEDRDTVIYLLQQQNAYLESVLNQFFVKVPSSDNRTY